MNKKAKLPSMFTEEPSKAAINVYSIRQNISLNEVREKPRENYRKEVEEVQAKEVALKASNSLKLLSPRIMGLKNREMQKDEDFKNINQRLKTGTATRYINHAQGRLCPIGFLGLDLRIKNIPKTWYKYALVLGKAKKSQNNCKNNLSLKTSFLNIQKKDD